MYLGREIETTTPSSCRGQQVVGWRNHGSRVLGHPGLPDDCDKEVNSLHTGLYKYEGGLIAFVASAGVAARGQERYQNAARETDASVQFMHVADGTLVSEKMTVRVRSTRKTVRARARARVLYCVLCVQYFVPGLRNTSHAGIQIPANDRGKRRDSMVLVTGGEGRWWAQSDVWEQRAQVQLRKPVLAPA